MLEIAQDLFAVINTAHDIAERIIGFRPIDAVAVIFIVSLINSSFHLKERYERRHTLILSLTCLIVSIMWAAIAVEGVEGLSWFKSVFSLGFRLASISTLSYNIFKPITRPVINRFYKWLRSKGIEVPEVKDV